MRGKRLGGVGVIALAVLVCGASSGSDHGKPSPPGGPANAAVSVYGRAGSFGALADTTPSGQSIALRPVSGWGFPSGRQGFATVVTRDGTVLIAGRESATSLLEDPRTSTSAEMVIAAFDPPSDTYELLRLPTMAGRIEGAGAPSVADLEPIGDGGAVAFVAASPPPETAAGDQWPVFGILTNTDGGWRIAAEPEQTTGSTAGSTPRSRAGWTNQWRAADLVGSGLAESSAVELTTLPASRDLIVTQRHPDASDHRNGALLALRVTGPDDAGRYAVRVMDRYVYPEIDNPDTSDHRARLKISPQAIRPDPTSVAGDERFAVTLVATNSTAPDSAATNDTAPDNPVVIQEFSYDAGTGRIRPTSAPLIPGDLAADGRQLFGYGAMLYDRQGNLWASRVNGFQGGSLAVYVAGATGRRPGSPECPYEDTRELSDYQTTVDGRTVWGASCRPDYDLLQAKEYLAPMGLVEDSTSGDIVSLHFGGVLLPVRPIGSGHAMTFQVGNQVDLGQKLMPLPEGTLAIAQLGGFDGKRRLWISSLHGNLAATTAPADQWLYAVDVPDLFHPSPVALSSTPGWSVTLQAERTATMATNQRPGKWATVDVDSAAYLRACVEGWSGDGCAYDSTAGNGFALADDTGYGHLRGTLEYRVRVPRAGTYRVAYRVATFAVTTEARIELSAVDQTYVTPVGTGGGWHTIEVERLVALPAGVQTIRISVPPGGGGWYLNSISLQRT